MIRRRVLARQLRLLREQSGLTLELRWFTSSFSGGNGENCVEVAFSVNGSVAVRDTKDPTLAPHRYSAACWAEFLAGVRSSEFDRP
jgi:Domain of unknown function (DUF397)